MRDIVRAYIEKYRLLTDNRPVLVGVSGGADSIALLSLLGELGYSCIAAHCNFHLRGEESMRDERFVEEFVRSLGIPYYKVDFDTNRYAAERHLSVEMAARELRYDWFEKMRAKLDAQAIAVAHHRDDSVETLLLNLMRGTGIRGLSGIRAKNGYVIRPLLGVSRAEILEWLECRSLTYVTDSTNLSDAYTRNFIRLRVLPLLEEINPSVKTAIARTSEHLAAAEVLYLCAVEEAKSRIIEGDRLSITALLQFPSPEAILYELLKDWQFTRPVVEDIFRSLEKESGKLFYSSTHRLIKDRDYLLLSPLEARPVKEFILTGDEAYWSGPVELSFEKIVIYKDFQIQMNKETACFDYDKLTFPLTLRTWRSGDWFAPFGMKGRKKLSDYFSDCKFSLMEKEQTWLLCSGADIVWIVGERSDNRYRIDKTTKNVLIVKKKR